MLVGIAVGYQNLKTADVAGAVMNAIPFIDLSTTSDDGYWLSDLKPQGYLNNSALKKNGVSGQFSVQLLNENGAAIAIYKWAHGAGKSGWQDNARWVDPDNQTVVPGGENDLTIEPGQGLWVFAPAHNGDVGTDYTIQVKCPAF